MSQQNALAAAIRQTTNSYGWQVICENFRERLAEKAKQQIADCPAWPGAADRAIGAAATMHEAYDLLVMLADNLGQTEAEPPAGLAEGALDE